ncbi:unnamed protein product, partial [Rotaria magnacalcarata]
VEFDLCIGSSSVSIPSSAREFDIWMWDQYPRLLSSFVYLWSNHKTLIKSCGSNCSQCIVIDGHQKCRRRVCHAKNVQVSTEEFESLTVGCCRTPSLGSRFCELHQVLDENNVTAEPLTKQKQNKKQKMMKKKIMGRYRQHGFGATNCRTIKQCSESYVKRCNRSFGILAGVTNCKIVITFSEIFRSETLREIIGLLCSTIRASNYNFPKCGVYDDGCHLVEFIRNHYGQDLKRTSASTSLYETKFSVDRTHFKGHVGRWCRANMNPYKNEMLNGINTQAAEQLFSWVKTYANILSSLGWRKMPIYLLLLFHYKNLERMSIRPTHVFNIASSVPLTPTVSLAHAADTEQVSKYKEQQKQKKVAPSTTDETSRTVEQFLDFGGYCPPLEEEEQSLFIDENIKSADSIPFVPEVVIENTEVSSSNSSNNHSDDEENEDQLIEKEIKLQEDYELPPFPADLKFVVDQKDLTKLAAHSNLRRVLLNLVYDDFANKHHLLYPKSQDYIIIKKAILRSLNISLDNKDSLNEYRESIKQKFKNERKPLQKINAQVQRNKNKFGKGPGRPMLIGQLDDEQGMFKLNQMLKDEFNRNPVNMEAITYFWKKTFTYRRLFTRNNIIKEVLLEYPAYSLASLASYLITPAPFIKMLNDRYELHLDYQLIAQTTSAEEAISVPLCLYNIFEIKFARHSRGINLLYGIIFHDQNELSKSMRKCLLSWDYIITSKSISRQHQTKNTTVNTNSMIQSTASTETNKNDLNVLEETHFIQNEQVNNVCRDPTVNHSFNYTQELVAKENTCTLSNTQEGEFILSGKESTAPPTDLNIFQTIDKTSFATEETTISTQHPKKRKQTKSNIEATTLPRRQQPKRSRLT